MLQFIFVLQYECSYTLRPIKFDISLQIGLMTTVKLNYSCLCLQLSEYVHEKEVYIFATCFEGQSYASILLIFSKRSQEVG